MLSDFFKALVKNKMTNVKGIKIGRVLTTEEGELVGIEEVSEIDGKKRGRIRFRFRLLLIFYS